MHTTPRPDHKDQSDRLQNPRTHHSRNRSQLEKSTPTPCPESSGEPPTESTNSPQPQPFTPGSSRARPNGIHGHELQRESSERATTATDSKENPARASPPPRHRRNRSRLNHREQGPANHQANRQTESTNSKENPRNEQAIASPMQTIVCSLDFLWRVVLSFCWWFFRQTREPPPQPFTPESSRARPRKSSGSKPKARPRKSSGEPPNRIQQEQAHHHGTAATVHA